METYSLRLVTEFLKSKSIPFQYLNAKVGCAFYDHGCRIDIDDDYKMSIQTHPMIAGSAFAETAIQSLKLNKIVYYKFGYDDDVMCHKTPEDLFRHIEYVLGDQSYRA